MTPGDATSPERTPPEVMPSAADEVPNVGSDESGPDTPDPAETRIREWFAPSVWIDAKHPVATLAFGRARPDQISELYPKDEDFVRQYVDKPPIEDVRRAGRLLRWHLAHDVTAVDPRAIREYRRRGLHHRGITLVFELAASEPVGNSYRIVRSHDVLERYDYLTWTLESTWNRIWENWPPARRPAFIVARPDGAVGLGALFPNVNGVSGALAAFPLLTGDEMLLSHLVLERIVPRLTAGDAIAAEELAEPIGKAAVRGRGMTTGFASRSIRYLREQGLLRRADPSLSYTPLRPRHKRPLQLHMSAVAAAESAYWRDVRWAYDYEAERYGPEFFRRDEFQDAAWFSNGRIEPTVRTLARWAKLVMRLRTAGVQAG